MYWMIQIVVLNSHQGISFFITLNVPETIAHITTDTPSQPTIVISVSSNEKENRTRTTNVSTGRKTRARHPGVKFLTLSFSDFCNCFIAA
jgi:hypothetical protein